MAGVSEIVFGAPEPAVDVHDDGERSLGLGDAQVAELIGIGAIAKAGIGRRGRCN